MSYSLPLHIESAHNAFHILFFRQLLYFIYKRTRVYDSREDFIGIYEFREEKKGFVTVKMFYTGTPSPISQSLRA